MSISVSKKTQHIVAQRIASVPAPTSEVDIAQLHQSLPFILTSALEMLIDGETDVAARILAATIARLG